MKDHNIKMISLNIRSLNDKLTILRQIMKDQHYDILLLQETHLKVTEVRNLLDYTLYCSSNAEHVWAGVAIMIHNKLIRFVSFNPISSRICCLTLNLGYKKVHLFNIYAPHNDSVFYMELENVLKELPHRDGIILAGDFNASVGKSKNSSCLGNATLIQSTNPNGKRLIEICELFNLKIGNTFFNHPTHHIMTYKSPSFGTTSQIDFFIISTKIFKWVKDIRAFQSLKLLNTFKTNPLPRLQLNNNKIITDPKEQLDLWIDHYMNLYKTRWPRPRCDYPFQSPSQNLNKSDIVGAIKRLKMHKAAGADGIFAELWKIEVDLSSSLLLPLFREIIFNVIMNDILNKSFKQEYALNTYYSDQQHLNDMHNSLNFLGYADDVCILANSEYKLRNILSLFVNNCDGYGLRVNYTKTKLITSNTDASNLNPLIR
ncbi:uncharacterized protein LOC135929305 [Gordionus sp. m RMFG-2023]|uniref:uncharacterized protein LOC135929305 n=1 Tax=Gordionus sp. m RMFG-2023 TaxID=3053472 RepID=UPI0031FDABAC